MVGIFAVNSDHCCFDASAALLHAAHELTFIDSTVRLSQSRVALLFVYVSLALDINLLLAQRVTESTDLMLIFTHSYYGGAKLIPKL